MTNYFEDSYKKEGLTLKDLQNAKFINEKDRKIIVNNIEYKYKDADSYSTKLYEDLKRVYEPKFKKLKPSVDIISCDKYKIVLSNGLKLTSDYLGPSTTTARHVNYGSDKALKNIINCRILGGHILWPITLPVKPIKAKKATSFYTINCKRALTGSRGYGISDRIDIALYEIKRYLDKDTKSVCYNETFANLLNGKISELTAEDCKKIKNINDKFFSMFDNDFKKFCDFFDLVGSFVNEKYEVNIFIDMERKKITVDDYQKYVTKNIKAIEDRQKNI